MAWLFFVLFALASGAPTPVPVLDQELSLVFVQGYWRHGDRAPDALPYPFDRYNEDYWYRGWGQLTNIGINQAYELGTYLQERYVGSFVEAKYNYSEVFVRSSDADRALTTAQSVMGGFFPPSGNEVWMSGVHWQPIPIHASGTGEQDPLLQPSHYDCPYFDELWDKSVKKQVTKFVQGEYPDIMAMLGPVTGYGSDISLKKAAHLIDITREVIHNMTQPSWVLQSWSNHNGNTTLDVITEIYRLRRMAEFDGDLTILRGGYILDDLLQTLQNASNGVFTDAGKAKFYSTHDSTLLALMFSLGIQDYQLVPYAATILVELSKDNANNYFVQFTYRKNGKNQVLTVPGCKEQCPLDTLLKLSAKKRVSSIKALNKLCDQ